MDLFYGLLNNGVLVHLIFDREQATTKFLNVKLPIDLFHVNYTFLIESKGELYSVRSIEIFRTKTIKGFNVFKMDFSQMQWVAVRDIGDQAFFLDFVTDGLSCDADNQAGLKNNCIYYIDDNHCIYQYSIEDRTIIMLALLNHIETPWHYPLWVSTQCIQDGTSFDNYTSLENISDHMTYSENDLNAPKQLPNKDICTTSRREAELLPNLLPELVLHHLSYLDSRYACIAIPEFHPTIRSARKPISASWQHNSPCHLSFSDDYKTCRLVDPLRNSEWLIKPPNITPDVKVLYCNHGWLLLMFPYTRLIFYNPLSQVVIKVPNFICYSVNFTLSFSSPPTSSDCVIVAANFREGLRWITICRKGESKWKEIIYKRGLDRHMYNPLFESTGVFANSSFYWLAEGGEIGVLNLVTETFEVCVITNKNISKIHRRYLVECNGVLFWGLATNDGDSVCVYKLDRLGGRCFFLSQENSIGVSSSSLWDGVERLYFPMLQNERSVYYYSMQTCKLFPNDDFIGGKELLHNSSWIEPNWAQHTSEELQW
ncbi:hypothetical protein LUZ60_000161 [Juncus effusus]|nr:hypothetical protein LUZ60_000161 [Juncus effusus]